MSQQLVGTDAAAITSNRPPPPPPQTQWYIYHNGQQLGAVCLESVNATGTNGSNPGLEAGMAGWQSVAEIPELSSLLASAPPPPTQSHGISPER
jgi:hypothetical protein